MLKSVKSDLSIHAAQHGSQRTPLARPVSWRFFMRAVSCRRALPSIEPASGAAEAQRWAALNPYSPVEQPDIPDIPDSRTYRTYRTAGHTGHTGQPDIPDSRAYRTAGQPDIPDSRTYRTAGQSDIPDSRTAGHTGQPDIPDSRTYRTAGQPDIPGSRTYRTAGHTGQPDRPHPTPAAQHRSQQTPLARPTTWALCMTRSRADARLASWNLPAALLKLVLGGPST